MPSSSEQCKWRACVGDETTLFEEKDTCMFDDS